MATSIGQLSLIVTANSSQLQAAMNKVGTNLAQTQNKVTLLQKAFQALNSIDLKGMMGQLAGEAGFAGVAGSLAGMVRIGAQFEQSMARIKAIARPTAEQFAALTAQARELGRTTEFTSSQTAEAMAKLALAGFKFHDIMKATPQVLHLAAVGQLELAEAADFTATVMAGMGKTSDELGGIVDKLAYALSNSNSNMLELRDAFKYAGPIATNAGRSFDEVTAAIMALQDAGLKGEMAGTALRNLTMRMADRTPEAIRMMDFLGLSFQDAAGNALRFDQIIDKLNQTFDDLGLTTQERIEAMGTMFEMRAASAAAAVMKSADKMRKHMGKLRSEVHGLGEEMHQIQMDTTTGEWLRFRSAVEDLGIAIFQLVKGPLRAALEDFTRLANTLTGLIPGGGGGGGASPLAAGLVGWGLGGRAVGLAAAGGAAAGLSSENLLAAGAGALVAGPLGALVAGIGYKAGELLTKGIRDSMGLNQQARVTYVKRTRPWPGEDHRQEGLVGRMFGMTSRGLVGQMLHDVSDAPGSRRSIHQLMLTAEAVGEMTDALQKQRRELSMGVAALKAFEAGQKGASFLQKQQVFFVAAQAAQVDRLKRLQGSVSQAMDQAAPEQGTGPAALTMGSAAAVSAINAWNAARMNTDRTMIDLQKVVAREIEKDRIANQQAKDILKELSRQLGVNVDQID